MERNAIIGCIRGDGEAEDAQHPATPGDALRAMGAHDVGCWDSIGLAMGFELVDRLDLSRVGADNGDRYGCFTIISSVAGNAFSIFNALRLCGFAAWNSNNILLN